jgi:AcrR family transcriptional regulator
MRNKSRQAILKAALRLFAHKGYAETTTEDIAQKVGISKGLIYNYFPSKEKILEHLIDAFVARIVPVMPLVEGDQPTAKYLEAMIRGWFTELRTNPDLIKLGVQFHTDTGLKKLVRKKQAELEKEYVVLFEEVFRRLGSSDPVVDTLLLESIMDGVGLNYAASPDTFPLDRMEQHLVKQYCAPRGKTR